jgi:hypothetical protein
MEMITSEKQDQIVPALIEARKKITGAKADKDNPFFKSKYADLPSVIECVNDALLENGVLITQPTQIIEGKVILVTELMHVSGQWKRGFLPIINRKGDDQGQGSSMTYTRRQGLLSMLSIPTLDDDAEATVDPKIRNKKNGSKPKVEDDVPYGEIPTKTITKPQQKAFISHVNKCGVKQDAAINLIGSHGYETTADILKDDLKKLEKEIAGLGKIMGAK